MLPRVFTFASRATGDREVSLGLDQVSVLLGANDSGKSQALKSLYAALTYLRAVDENDDVRVPEGLAPPLRWRVVLGARDFADIEALLRSGLSSLSASVAPWVEVLESAESEDPVLPGDLEELVSDPEPWSEAQLRTALVRTVEHGLGGRLSRADAQAVADAVLECGAVGFRADSERTDVELQFLAGREILGGLAVREVPPASPQGTASVALSLPFNTAGESSPELPETFWLPQPTDHVVLHVARQVGALAEALAGGAAAESHDGGDVQSPYASWIEPSDDEAALVVRPDIELACALLEQLAGRTLPSFVSEHYRLRAQFAGITRLLDSEGLLLELQPTRGGAAFPVASCADGHRLWLQLALLESASVLRRLAAGIAEARRFLGVLRHPAGADDPHAEEGAGMLEAALDEIERRADVCRGLLSRGMEEGEEFSDAAMDLLSLAGPQPLEVAAKALRPPEAGALAGPLEVQGVIRPPTNCYFIDEPEQHLHPLVARRAARWLGKTLADTGARAVIATHSVAFIDMEGPASHVYLWRAGGEAFAEPFDPEALEAAGLIAEEMGFDRGELMSSVRAMLFVEGRADQIVLETIYGADLRLAGCIVIPMQGVARIKGIIEADALFSFTTARIAVLLDTNVAQEAAAMQDDPTVLERALRDKRRTEIKAAAQLIRSAAHAERHVKVLGHSGDDIFDLLTERAIQAQGPEFPGHQAARERHAALPQKQHYKTFLRGTYGLGMDNAMFAAIAQDMHDHGERPADLTAVVASIAGLAGE